MGTRELKKSRTRRELADAAIRLFAERGFSNVTMADVALEAGVSRRTAFRYFPSKDDLVMQHPAEWLIVFDESVEANAHLRLGDRIRLASYAVAAHIEADPVPVRQLFALAFAHPSLAGRYAASSAAWIERMAEEIGRDLPDETEAQMLAAAVMGIINAVCEIWAADDQPMVPLLERGLALMSERLDGRPRP